MPDGRRIVAFNVYPDDGEPYEAVISSRLLLAWEKTHKGNSGALLGGDVSSMYQLCHFEAQLRHGYTGTLEDFEASHDLDGDTDEDEEAPADGLDPTPPAPSTDSP